MKNENITIRHIKIEEVEDIQDKLELYSILEKVEDDISNGDEGVDFLEFVKKLRCKLMV